ncbi:MAG: hypothetical protein NVS9B3_10780 [Gemmatimonadaceae bacterium]
MSATARRAALDALAPARPIFSRLDATRNPEDTAADLIDGWGALQSALTTLAGGSALTGTALIRELRQRELLSLDQANALVEFQAARDRAQSTAYRPTRTDVAAARTAFQKLQDGLAAQSSSAPSAVSPAPVPTTATPAAPSPVAERRPLWVRALVGVVSLVIVAAIGWAAYVYLGPGSSSNATQRGIDYYTSGSREAARSEFQKAANDNPAQALPHVFLGRLAREDGDYITARGELERGIRLDPRSAVAQREMGALLYAQGSFDLAVNFYRRALEADPSDRSAAGYMGCALLRLGRADVAQRFLSRAGNGPWSSCAAPVGPPPGGVPPRGP